MNNQLTEESPVQVDEKTKQHFTTIRVDGHEYITITEFIRRRHAADLEKDPLANPLYDSSIRKVTRRGDIVLMKQGIHFFIDWDMYKNWVFHRYKQGPKKREESAAQMQIKNRIDRKATRKRK